MCRQRHVRPYMQHGFAWVWSVTALTPKSADFRSMWHVVTLVDVFRTMPPHGILHWSLVTWFVTCTYVGWDHCNECERAKHGNQFWLHLECSQTPPLHWLDFVIPCQQTIFFCSGYFSTLGCGFWLLPLPFALCLSLFLYLFFFVSAFVPSLSVVSSSVFFVFLVLLLIFVCSLLSPFLLIPLSSFSFSFFVFFLVLYFFSFCLPSPYFVLFLLLLFSSYSSPWSFVSLGFSVCLSSWLVLFWFCFFNYRSTPLRTCCNSGAGMSRFLPSKIDEHRNISVHEMLCNAMIHKNWNVM